MSVGIPDLSMPTISSQPRSIRWCAIEAPTMPPSPTITTFAFLGNSAILCDPSWYFHKTIVAGWSRHLPLYDILAASDDCIEACGNHHGVWEDCSIHDMPVDLEPYAVRPVKLIPERAVDF